jgi:Mrp family chromosome partitioning ATPase
MSKIYEALRRHDQNPTDGESSLAAPTWSGEDGFFKANRPTQTLFRSIESMLGGLQGGATIMFSSAQSGEGKTTVCGSFAATVAQNFGKSVLVLDADRAHVLTHHFGSNTEINFSTLEKNPEGILQAGKKFSASGSISVVPIGSAPGSGTGSSLEITGFAAAKSTLAKTFDYILIDAPSVSDVSWAPMLGAAADGVVLVVQAEHTRWPVVLNSKEEFEGNGAKVLGVFLNKRRFYVPDSIYNRV